MTTRGRTPWLIVTFPTTTDAMAMEKYCAEHGLPGRLVPTPTAITASCGLSWKAPPGTEARLADALTAAGIRWEGMAVLEFRS